jgi:hypothetical protein
MPQDGKLAMSEQSAPENSAAWLRDVIFGAARLRSPDASSVLLEQLISHYRGLSYTQQMKFQEAVLGGLAAARPEETDFLFHLLHLVAHTKPVNGPVVLRKLITSLELVYSPEAEAAGLESLALATQAEYGVDPWLADFLSRRLLERPDPRTAMAALELLAFQSEVPISVAFVELCRTEETEDYEDEFLRSAFTALRRTGMGRFYRELAESTLEHLAGDPQLPRSPFPQAFAGAMDRIGDRDRGYFPLRAVVTALLGDPVAPWLERCEPGVMMEIVDRVDLVRVTRGGEPLLVRPGTNPDYVDELVGDNRLAPMGLKVVEAQAVYYLPFLDATAAQPMLSARPPTPVASNEANATLVSLADMLQTITGQHVH